MKKILILILTLFTSLLVFSQSKRLYEQASDSDSLVTYKANYKNGFITKSDLLEGIPNLSKYNEFTEENKFTTLTHLSDIVSWTGNILFPQGSLYLGKNITAISEEPNMRNKSHGTYNLRGELFLGNRNTPVNGSSSSHTFRSQTIGARNLIGSKYGTTIGTRNENLSDRGVAIGGRNIFYNTAKRGFLAGFHNKSSGIQAFLIGSKNNAQITSRTVSILGAKNESYGRRSTIVGDGNRDHIKSFGNIIVGKGLKVYTRSPNSTHTIDNMILYGIWNSDYKLWRDTTSGTTDEERSAYVIGSGESDNDRRNSIVGWRDGRTEVNRLQIKQDLAVPYSMTSDGMKGEIRYNNTYLYICVDRNTWKRAYLNNWNNDN